MTENRDNELDEQRPEHDSVTPALEDEPHPDEPAANAGAEDASGRTGGDDDVDPALDLGGDDELKSGRFGPGTDQAGPS